VLQDDGSIHNKLFTGSPMTTSRSAPIVQRIECILLEKHGSPITLLELHGLLRRQGPPPPIDRLRALLADRRVFTELAGERYVLRDQLAAPIEDMQPLTEQRVFLGNLCAAADSYLVLDVETSGLDPERDQILQLSVLQVEDGHPTRFYEWFFQCDPASLTPALRRILHLDDTKVAQITAAPPLNRLLPDIRAVLANLPLVIHNARFDMGFLQKALPELVNPVVDTMELALLVAPNAPNHKLATLAAHLGIMLSSISCAGIDGVPAGHVVNEETLHDATTDVLLLDAVYRALLHRWHQLPQPHARLLATLMPEVTSREEISTTELATLLRDHPEPTPEEHLPQHVDSLALLDHVLAARGGAPRPSQRAMVEITAEALVSNTSRLIEAPTGTGKTLGYLVPAIWAARREGRRIAVATAMKNLQDQVRDEIERLQAIMPFRAQVLKGAASYICLRNLQQAINDSTDASLERRYVLAFLARWVGEATPNALPTIDELPFWLRRTFPETDLLAHEIAVDRLDCTDRRCPFFDDCHLFTAYRRAEQSDILLLNHSLWLSEPQAMPPFDALMLDEAHNLEDRATAAYQQEVSEASLRALLRRLAIPGTRRGALQRVLDLGPAPALRERVHRARHATGQALTLLLELRATLGMFVVGCDERLRPEQGAQLRLNGRPDRVYPTRWKGVQDAIQQLWRIFIADICACLRDISSMLPEAQHVLIRQLDAVRERLIEQEQLLATILEARRTDLITWITVATAGDRPGWAFFAAPLNVAPMLADAYRKLRTVVLTSATLTTGAHDFHFFIERLGLREVLRSSDIVALDGVLPYGENVLLAIPSYLSYTPAQQTIQSFVEELAAELTMLCTYTDGRTLALFTARNRLEAVWSQNHEALEAHGVTVLAQRSGESRQRLIEQFREGGAVLYGLRSFWEGIDVPGDALSFVVMEKLPYPALNDPVTKARMDDVRQRSGRDFQDYLLPLMIIQFKQGFGRLLRDENDCGAVILYDRRINRKSYLRELLGALPGFQERDLVAERGRRTFYRLIAERLPGLIDLDAKADLLDTLPDILTTNLEVLVERLALPEIISDDEYEAWRPQILEAIRELYKHEGFRSGEQEAALRAMLSGRDVIAVLPTGAGKSLCFQLPALLRSGLTVICSPLIALMRDQIDKLQENRIEIAAALMSGQSAAEREEILSRARNGRLRLLYLAPERLRDPVVLAALASASIRQIVIDEAHCVALWGPSFRPDFLALPQVYDRLMQRPPVAAFTATATPAITGTIKDALRLHAPIFVRAPIDRPELRLVVLDRSHRYQPIRSKTEQIRRLLMLVQTADRSGESMLVYVATTAKSEELARLLQVAGYPARAYHGKMPMQERANVSELFMEGLISIVVCTKAFGMGIDKPDIRYVVHFNSPGDIESYAQEIGRAGRDGHESYAVLLYHPSDERIQRYFIDQSRPDHELLAELWQWMRLQPELWTLDPQEVCDRFDIDDLALRRAIYLLEHAGLIERGPDVTVRANVTLLGGWDDVLWLASERQTALLAQLQKVLHTLGYERQEIVLADLALSLNCPAAEIETVLIDFAVAGGCLYRPWEKGYQIRQLATPDALLPTIGVEAVAAQEQKLEHMRTLVHSRECRWQMLRRYFGEAPGSSCGTCDRCDPERLHPWSNTIERDVPDVSDVISLGTTLLEVVDWNERRATERRGQFSALTLLRILRGDQYTLMRHTPPGAAAEARLAALRSCPYWGVCRTLRRSEADLQAALDRLIREAYLERTETIRADGTIYMTLRLAEHGRESLQRAERLNW
jgi:ATP-dependent DNA helicase RecQ